MSFLLCLSHRDFLLVLWSLFVWRTGNARFSVDHGLIVLLNRDIDEHDRLAQAQGVP